MAPGCSGGVGVDNGASSGAGSGVSSGAGAGDDGAGGDGAGVGLSAGLGAAGVEGGNISTCGTRMAKEVKWLTEAVTVLFTVSTSEGNVTHFPTELS
ncbi:hypothetical protein ES703_106495 [subsurface metagenome]